MSTVNLDEKDREILRMLVEDAKVSAKDIGTKINSPITTVYSRIKRLEATDAEVIGSTTVRKCFKTEVWPVLTAVIRLPYSS